MTAETMQNQRDETASPPAFVSVIVPTRDRPDMLRQALASIRALEGPDLRLEILVCDNGSSPDTVDAAADYQAAYLSVTREGAGAARNEGLLAASGDFIAFLDDDDVWLDTHIRPHLALLRARPEIDAVFSRFIYADPALEPIADPLPVAPPAGGDALIRFLLEGFFPQIGTLLVRREVLNQIGLFDETLIGGQDFDWIIRFARRRRLGFSPTGSVLFRSRPAGSYDALQRRRLTFDRQIFWRHALGEWRIWRSPLGLRRAHDLAVWHFYDYFREAALARSRAGDRKGARAAFKDAFGIFPLRSLRFWLAETRRRAEAAKAPTPPEDGPIEIGMGFDARYAPHAGVTIRSVVRHRAAGQFRFTLAVFDVDAETRAAVEACAPGAQFRWIEARPEDFPEFGPRKHLNWTVLLRLRLDRYAPETAARMIYLDADVVCQADIEPLWRAELGPNAIGAARDSWVTLDRLAAQFPQAPARQPYFNAGILLFDLTKIRADDRFSEALGIIAHHGETLEFGDQDALNLVFWNAWTELDFTWNVQRYLDRGQQRRAIDERRADPIGLDGRRPAFFHFIGPDKPWRPAIWHPWAWAYWREARSTPLFARIRAENRVGTIHLLRYWYRWQIKQPRGRTPD